MKNKTGRKRRYSKKNTRNKTAKRAPYRKRGGDLDDILGSNPVADHIEYVIFQYMQTDIQAIYGEDTYWTENKYQRSIALLYNENKINKVARFLAGQYYISNQFSDFYKSIVFMVNSNSEEPYKLTQEQADKIALAFLNDPNLFTKDGKKMIDGHTAALLFQLGRLVL